MWESGRDWAKLSNRLGPEASLDKQTIDKWQVTFLLRESICSDRRAICPEEQAVQSINWFSRIS